MTANVRCVTCKTKNKVSNKMPKSTKFNTRVELHSHLDGSIRPETIWELSQQKEITLPGNGSLYDLRNKLVVRDPIDLGHFLAPFQYILPPIQDDLKAIERIAYEYIEDKAANDVAYVEARFSPHGLLTSKNWDMPHFEAVVDAVATGLNRGRTDFNVRSSIILCTLIGDNTAEETLKICERTKDLGVVAIDTASKFDKARNNDEVPLGGMEPKVFQRAKDLGLHRTVHAGERGPAEMVQRAVLYYGAERIGHGYHVIEDQNIYADAMKKNIHFECCPYSSLYTGSVPMGIKEHPIARFSADAANFSLSTDDSTVTGYNLTDDYKLFQTWVPSEGAALRASINAAKSAFLPEDERKALVKHIYQSVFGNSEQ